MKKNLILLLSFVIGLLSLASCEETMEAPEYDNWQQRNNIFIDSIAEVARANDDGSWRVFLGESVDTLETANDFYVYCKVLESGSGTAHPNYNDTILANYRGRLIPSRSYSNGYVFDETYNGVFDAEVDVPMKLFLNRLFVLSKRSLINPAMYVMSFILVVLALLVIFVPEKETSVYIPVAVLNKDNSPETEDIVEKLITSNSVFTFYEVDSEDELYDDIASGKANTAYIFPKGFSKNLTSDSKRYAVRQVTTPASSFVFLSREEVFDKFYAYGSRQVIIDTLADYGYEVGLDDPELNALFEKYIQDQSLFAVESTEGQVYNDITRSEKIPIPLYKFAGFFIFTAALLGALAFLNDQDNRIYQRFKLIERIYLGLIQVAVFTFPAAIVSIVCFLVSKTLFSPLHVILYTLLVTFIAFIVGTIMTLLPIRTARSKIFSAILPVYLILSFLFSGVLMDLTNFGVALRTLARCFPPSMF